MRAPLVELDPGFIFRPGIAHKVGTGRFHRGFAEEAMRISARIWDEIENGPDMQVDEIVLCGHSLGGAIAAICTPLLMGIGERTRTLIFGAPRYCDVAALFARPGQFPTQINRPRDIIPSVPPRSLGYADCPRQFDTLGDPILSSMRNLELPFILWRWALLLAKRFESHSIEAYRLELGQTCGADLATEPLIDALKLTKVQIKPAAGQGVA